MQLIRRASMQLDRSNCTTSTKQEF
uniref:Uncharacterized protein n=1 Tax=Arundo donax TaxID=35708 RepID=A0A0A9FBA4_ARUDO